MIYFELFHLNPIQIGITYLGLTGLQNKYEKSLGQKLGVPTLSAIASIEDAQLRLNGLLLKNPFSTRNDLVSKITQHFIRQGIAQSYNIIGSVDILGNPIGLVSNLGTGVADFFYEPAKGVTKSPAAFGVGVAKGTTSLVKNSTYGLFNTASKLTGGVGKGLATLTFDEEYLAERQRNNISDKPKHVGEGLLYGARDLGKGIFGGVTGVVTQPVKGAMNEGAVGFLKGFGRGVVGTIVKPVTGVTDLVSQTAKGIRNTTTYWDNENFRPKRPQRYFGRDLSLTPYSEQAARGNQLLAKVRKHPDEYYLNHDPGRQWIVSTVNIYLLGDKKEVYPLAELDSKGQTGSLGVFFIHKKTKKHIFLTTPKTCTEQFKIYLVGQIEEAIELAEILNPPNF